MLRYNVEQLREDADCRQVAEYIGMQLNGKFCECVSGLHTETQINHCGIYRNHVHCFSCGYDVGVIRMVQDYYTNVLGQTLAYQEACRIVGDACGGSELYLEQVSGQSSAERIPFSKEELAMIRLDTPYSGNGSHLSMQSLYREDRDLFFEIIRQKATEEKNKLESLRSRLGNSPYEAGVKNVIEQRLIKIRQLYKKAGGIVPLQVKFKL